MAKITVKVTDVSGNRINEVAAMIVHIGQMNCYQRYNLKSPLTAKAAAWAEQHLSALPLQKIDLSIGL